MEKKVRVTEERISHSIHFCFPANISEPDSSTFDEQPLPQFCASIASIFPVTISESDSSSSVLSCERLPQFCPSIHSIFPPPTSTQTSSPANDEIIPYHPIDSCFPPRCSDYSDSDSLVPYDIIHKYLRSISIQSCFPSFRSSSSVVYDHPVDSDSSLNFESYPYYPNRKILEKPNLKEFSFADLKTATKNFTPCAVTCSLGDEGGFVSVFKGWMDEKTLSPSTMLVAIKILSLESMQGCPDYFKNCLGSLSHPNLVELLGYCLKDEQLLLVYEFMQNGSLENHLFERSLSWDVRLKIAIGAARDLAFLQASKKQVILGDFKTSNILLDRNYNAKISYLDLAKFEPPDFNSSLYPGASKFSATDHLYLKSDVYGFGVVLLEMLTGLRKIDTKMPNLMNWIRPYLFNERKLKTISSKKRKLKTIMDMRIEGQYSSMAALQATQLALRCIESNPKNHLSMRDVVEALERIDAIEKLKKTKIKFYST